MDRRRFLKIAAAGTAGSMLPQVLTGCDESGYTGSDADSRYRSTSESNSSRKKVIVIGTGCGGAAAAAIAAYHGHDTTIYEKNRDIGGKTHTFHLTSDEGLWKMDHGHMIARADMGPHGDLLKLVDAEEFNPKWSHLLNWGVKVGVGGVNYDFRPIPSVAPILWKPFGLVLGILKSFPGILNGVGILAFLADCAVVPERVIQKRYDNISLETFLSKFFRNQRYHSFFGGLGIVTMGCGPTEVSAGEAVRIFKHAAYNLIRFAYPANGEGVQAIPNSFLSAAKKYHAKVVVNSPIEKILVQNNTVKGVRIDGEDIPADIVISNTGALETLYLVGEDEFDDADYVRKIKNLKYGIGGVSLKFALKKKITNYHMFADIPLDLLGTYEKMAAGQIPDSKNQYLPFMAMVPSNVDPSLCPSGCQTICAISGGANNIDPRTMDWEPWGDAFKKRLELMIPGLKENSLFIDEMDPVDIANYGGAIMGDAVGASQSIDQVGENRPSIVSPIKGLYQVGSDFGKGEVATELATESAIRLEPYLRRT